MMARHLLSLTAVAAAFVLLPSGAGCGGTAGSNGFESGDGGGGGVEGDDGGITGVGTFGDGGSTSPPGPCTGLQCQVHSCSSGASTTISGRVFDPAGKNPLYGIVVYVPNAPLAKLTPGAACYSCSDLYSGQPITTALTDPSGHFVLKNAPDGPNIPIVVQIGKWRMQYTLPKVSQCADNPQPDGELHLPKNHSEGDIPSIAISTGGADSLECLLLRMGVDPAEYGGGASGAGRIHIFQGGSIGGGLGGFGGAPNTSPPGPSSAASLWDSKADLMPYDVVLLSCEGQETQNMNQQALVDYTSAGGRVFASHFHYAWFDSGPFGADHLATWAPGAVPLGAGTIRGAIDTTLSNGQPFPKGQAMLQWLGNVGALTNGELTIYQPKHNADVTASNTASQEWIHADTSSDGNVQATQYFSFDTPVGVPSSMQCGRVVYSDLHVGGATVDYGGLVSVGGVTPSGCKSAELSAQEKALEFMLFDLSSCLTPIGQPPQPPPPSVQ